MQTANYNESNDGWWHLAELLLVLKFLSGPLHILLLARDGEGLSAGWSTGDNIPFVDNLGI